MNIRSDGNNLVCADVLDPQLVVATFSNDLTERAKETLATEIVAGMDLLAIYKKYQRHGDVDSIRDVMRLLEEMSRVFDAYELAMFGIGRRYD